jgi:hypothetical protein
MRYLPLPANADDSGQPDVVEYAAVDRGMMMKNRKQAKEETDDVKNENGYLICI